MTTTPRDPADDPSVAPSEAPATDPDTTPETDPIEPDAPRPAPDGGETTQPE